MTESTHSHTHTHTCCNAKKDESYKTMCALRNLTYIGSYCQAPRTYCFSHSHKYMFQYTNKHALSTVRGTCVLGPGQGEQYERAYIYDQAGRRRESVSLSVCLSVHRPHTAWSIFRGHQYNSSSTGLSIHLVAL